MIAAARWRGSSWLRRGCPCGSPWLPGSWRCSCARSEWNEPRHRLQVTSCHPRTTRGRRRPWVGRWPRGRRGDRAHAARAPGGERERSPAGIPMRPRRKPPQVVPMPGELGGHKGEALTKLEDEEVRASREPTHGAASTGRQECKGYKITLQEYEENADKKRQQIEFSDLNI